MYDTLKQAQAILPQRCLKRGANTHEHCAYLHLGSECGYLTCCVMSIVNIIVFTYRDMGGSRADLPLSPNANFMDIPEPPLIVESVFLSVAVWEEGDVHAK